MAKAILIMDMPESCDMCDFVDDEQPPRYGEKTLYCGIPGMGEDVTDYIACRPEFCPLRKLPDEKCGAWTDGMIAAYNKYLSEVLERKE